MEHKVYSLTNKIWKPLYEGIDEQKLILDIAIDKKVLDLFHIGHYYYFVLDIKAGRFDFVSDEVVSVLGYSKDELSVPFLMQNIHPEDQPYFLNFENKVVEFFATLSSNQFPNYKVSYDYRIKKKDGVYLRILQQVVTTGYDERNHILKTFCVHTDITHIKPYGKPSLSFIGLNGEPSFYNVEVTEVFKASTFITKREREILCLLANGKSSSDISEMLFVSKETVSTHRKNLLQKMECTNTTELIAKCIQNGFL